MRPGLRRHVAPPYTALGWLYEGFKIKNHRLKMLYLYVKSIFVSLVIEFGLYFFENNSVLFLKMLERLFGIKYMIVICAII